MTTTLIYLNWLNLRRDYLGLSLIFLLPIIFFTLYAVLFGKDGVQGRTTELVAVLVQDNDRTQSSQDFINVIKQHGIFQIQGAPSDTSDARQSLSETQLMQQVLDGQFQAALVVPEGFEAQLQNLKRDAAQPIALLYDASNPLTRYTLPDLLQRSAMAVKLAQLLDNNPKCTLSNPELTISKTDPAKPLATAIQSLCPGSLNFVPLKQTAVTSSDVDPVSYYAAAVSMMFLLFAMSGAGGFLLEQQEAGTLERLLNCNVGMGRLLISSWLFFALVGIVQVAVTFSWGALFFGIDLWTLNHLCGSLLITLLAALCASSFGIVLAVLCKSRAQLNGISTLVILMMSAIGGSMVPRFIMPVFMQKLSFLTINGWVLDGFSKVFAPGIPQASLGLILHSLKLNCLVLSIMTLLCLVCAYALSRRWETV